ncbi:MAG: helix-turn-helix transcriptional regulator [Clostridia bacterium]|nr:helix-turn-helix transcriptional regulator [Clostridia bacterium]
MMKNPNEKYNQTTTNERFTAVSNIAENIKEFRLSKGISQKNLADAVGVSQKAVDYWERGVNEPKATYILRLADFFDVSCDELLGRNPF